jgi:fibronectin type 3 domain-containing protein
VADNTWDELTLNYGNAPTLGSVMTNSGAFTAGNWVALDVTSYITGEGTYSIGLNTTGAAALSFASREATANPPQLVIDLLNGETDTQAPSTPSAFSAVVANSTQVNLSWAAASDNIGVNGYTVYRDGTALATVPAASLSYSDTTALPGKTYSYSVDAFDSAGNHSTPSAAVSVNTPDTLAPSVPNGLAATVVNTTQIDLAWVASTDNIAVTGYTIYRDGAVLTTVAGDVLTYSDTAVLSGHTYNYAIDAFDAAGNHSAKAPAVQATPPDTEAPSTPGGLTTTASSGTQVDLTWTASTDNFAVTGYTIYRDGTSIANVPAASLAYSDKTVLPLMSYSYTVDAFDAAGNRSTASAPAQVNTPKMPANLTFSPSADTYVNAGSPTSSFGKSTSLRASASPDLHSYLKFVVQGLGGTPITRARLLVFANSNGSQGVNALAVADNTWDELTMNYGNAPSLGNTLASSGAFTTGNWVALDVTSYITGEGTYTIALSTSGSTSLNFASREAATNTPQLVLDLQNGDPDTQPPSTPTGLAATAVNSNQVNLSWAASSDNIGVSGYTIYRDGTTLTTVSGTTLVYSDTSALAGHVYSYTVDAFDAAGNHSVASSAVSVTTPDTQAPTVPGGLTATASSATLVKLSWTASTDDVGVNGYTIYRNGAVLTTVIGTTLAYSDKSVLATTTYTYAVDAFDKAGNHSAQTAPATVTTPDPPPTVPTGLTATVISSTQVDLAWAASTDNLAVAGYTIYRDGTVLTSVAGDVLSYSDTAVQAGKTYSYSVDAFDQPGSHSAASTPVSVTTPDVIAPSIPTSLSATASGSNKVNLAWAASADNVAVIGYTIYRDGTPLTTVSGATLSYSDTTVIPATTYSYTIDAFDAAGNHSAQTDPTPVTTPVIPSTLTFTPAADTYVNSSNPTANFGRATSLRISLSPDQHAYLRFTVQGLGGKSIARARILIFANSNGSQGINILGVSDNTWSELTMNYNNAPALGSVIATSSPFTNGTWVSVDVTPYLTGEGTYSFGIATTGNSALNLSSKESGVNAPQLVIDLQ